MTRSGQLAGVLLWEAKRAKEWSLKQRTAPAEGQGYELEKCLGDQLQKKKLTVCICSLNSSNTNFCIHFYHSS